MYLTPEQQENGRRTFLKALAGTPALGLLAAAATRGRSLAVPCGSASSAPAARDAPCSTTWTPRMVRSARSATSTLHLPGARGDAVRRRAAA